MSLLVGVDVGGTFTDLISYDTGTGEHRVAKVPSTPSDQAVGLLGGIEELAVDAAAIDWLIHGTTVATNAVIERKGAHCGLLTTRGFGDVLELRRRDRPNLYGLRGEFVPLIPGPLRLEIRERRLADGTVVAGIDPDEIEAAGRRLLAAGVVSVVVSYLHSYRYPEHEQETKEILSRFWPNEHVVCGSELVPEIREFERTSTAVVNGYVRPVVTRYLTSLTEKLTERGFDGRFFVVQSTGGTMGADLAKGEAVRTVLSGPAAGVIAAGRLGAAAGFRRIITCDMGGTSLDTALVVDATPHQATGRDLDYGVPVQVPMMSIETIGAGGGSIARVDASGLLRVGPESAGADPGPACYGAGGSRPTVTDADLVLNRINPSRPLGSWGRGGQRAGLDVEAAAEAIERHVAKPLGLDVVAAAAAIVAVVEDNIGRTIRTVSIDKGHHPAEFVLFAYGGAGPVHADGLRRALGVDGALIPLYPGLTAALGCLMTDARHDFVEMVHQPVRTVDARRITDCIERHVAEADVLFEREGVGSWERVRVVEADMSYVGQTHVLRVALESGDRGPEGLQRAFEAAYERQFGLLFEDLDVMLVTLRTAVAAVRPESQLRLRSRGSEDGVDAPVAEREVFFDGEWRRTRVHQRSALAAGMRLVGPAIVEQVDATTVVHPGSAAAVDDDGNLLIRSATAGDGRSGGAARNAVGLGIE